MKQFWVVFVGLLYCWACLQSFIQSLKSDSLTVADVLCSLPLLLLFIRLFFTTADSLDSQIFLNNSARVALAKDACPFCGAAEPKRYSLQVGYRKAHLDLGLRYNWVLWVNWKRWYSELDTRLPICESCRTKFLQSCKMKLFQRFNFNPNKVLKYKLGYLRGIQFPFLTGNLKPLDMSKW